VAEKKYGIEFAREWGGRNLPKTMLNAPQKCCCAMKNDSNKKKTKEKHENYYMYVLFFNF